MDTTVDEQRLEKVKVFFNKKGIYISKTFFELHPSSHFKPKRTKIKKYIKKRLRIYVVYIALTLYIYTVKHILCSCFLTHLVNNNTYNGVL